MLTNATTSCQVRLARKKQQLTNDSSSKKDHVELQGSSGQRRRPGSPAFMFLKLLMITQAGLIVVIGLIFFFKGVGGHLCAEVTISTSYVTTQDVYSLYL